MVSQFPAITGTGLNAGFGDRKVSLIARSHGPMPRVLFVISVVLFLGFPCRADRQGATSETRIELTVTPAAAPRPAFRYLLLPELKEMNPGNPIQVYMKCMMVDQSFFFDKEAFDRREKLLAMPLKDVSLRSLEDYGRFPLSEADRAARLDNPDWQILLKMRRDGFGTLLPEVQQLRALARALRVRLRGEVAAGRFDDAIRTAKTMFAMSRHLGEHPCFIGNLVGIAIAFVTIEPLDEMIEQPGCPNLFWAFSNLPAPFVSLRKAVEGERMTLHGAFRDLDSHAPMTAAELKKIIDPLTEAIADVNTPKLTLRDWIEKQAKDKDKLAAVRRRLVETGLEERQLLSFPPEQVILLDQKNELEIRFDALITTMQYPRWQIEDAVARIKHPEPAPLADGLIPAVVSVCKSQMRLDQRLALLVHVEALRLYAAEHSGKFPKALADVSLPLPADPFTGKPFRYKLAGATAHVRGSPPRSEQTSPHYNIHYELTLQQ
jgi:hypothetical protein